MHPNPYRVLVVDDDPDERFLLERAFGKALGSRGTVFSVGSGNEAIRYLAGEGPYADRATYPFPSFVLTDLQMNDGDGFDVLEFLRRNPGWFVIPKIVFTSSTDPDDIKTAYGLGATAYHQKPISADNLRACAEKLVDYWTECEVPPVDECGRLATTLHAGKLGERFSQPKPGQHMDWPITGLDERK